MNLSPIPFNKLKELGIRGTVRPSPLHQCNVIDSHPTVVKHMGATW